MSITAATKTCSFGMSWALSRLVDYISYCCTPGPLASGFGSSKLHGRPEESTKLEQEHYLGVSFNLKIPDQWVCMGLVHFPSSRWSSGGLHIVQSYTAALSEIAHVLHVLYKTRWTHPDEMVLPSSRHWHVTLRSEEHKKPTPIGPV